MSLRCRKGSKGPNIIYSLVRSCIIKISDRTTRIYLTIKPLEIIFLIV